MQMFMFLSQLQALSSSTKHFRLQALTFDPARWCLDDGGGVVFTAEVWKRRTEARRTEASGKRPERGADGSGGPRRSGRKGLRTHVRPARPGGREAGASLCWSHPETARLSLIRKQKSEKVNYFTVDLKLSYRKYRKGFESVVLFLHLTFLKSWFDGVQRFQQRRPSLFPLLLHPRPPRFRTEESSSWAHGSIYRGRAGLLT